ncbi:hypothetical protein AMS68_001043 [Peltaster fructicola]|uniref:DUF3074 domain-containing protein n=1 Tax=Peltaster fructicola TaxID=286661 RepID=A0A6H0XLE4_9PEZI|nr:hypothetical protein AMS68_001043 [Peltaster fructicola]
MTSSQTWAAARPTTNDPELGPFLRLHPLQPSQLPAHTDLVITDGSTRPRLAEFVKAVLDEAITFATSVLPNKFHVKSENKSASPASASVQLLAHEVDSVLPAAQGATSGKPLVENWFARISKHENAAKDGTATWEEFDAGLRQDHSQHEMDYTPEVKDAHLVVDYRAELASLQDSFGEWQDVHAEIREMLHQLPMPLEKRVFSVLVVSAKKAGEFIDVQLPLDLSGVSKAKYVDAPSITEGIYVSIEYGKLIDDGARVEWRMATASDAKGNLPMWAQKLGVPGAVVKDVGLFMDWRMRERNNRS